ncbi:TetR/AcrR family transcriptional regulator [Nocardia nova]|uniref:TetR/AcrR family transcriptional regulator n=1 Tax=Nocardia nova TaxID=37330 RepID=A0A2S6AVS6_9NOCA|nr:TetR/AcrR family transcriptional regulator [Nocardia nova]PPJ33503.1 TetR/AcrR family transcriptional regulator [Nocardia nova]PPJ39294.1 TetR/AcrR family transcriptional regulator [Nocardia nova]
MEDSDATPLDTRDTSPDATIGEDKLGARAIRTRNAILEASKQLFLERGYAGTRINNITDACGISRAGFYTYFRDKREIFDVLGETTYRELLDLVAEWDAVPNPAPRADVERWVRAYFHFMDRHGAFAMSAHSGPDDEDVRAATTRMQTRVIWLLGTALRNRQNRPTDAPEALGLTVQAMLERSWFLVHASRLPVSPSDVISAATDSIMASLTS